MFNLKRSLFLVSLLMVFIASPISAIYNLFSPASASKVYLPATMNNLCSHLHNNNDEDCYPDTFADVTTTIEMNETKLEYRGTVSKPDDENDFFKIHMLIGYIYTITVANLDGTGDIDLFVYSKPIPSSPDIVSVKKGAVTDRIVFKPTETKDYYILVYQYEAKTITHYLLSVETNAPQASATLIPTTPVIQTSTSTPTSTPLATLTSTPPPSLTPTPSTATSTPTTSLSDDGNNKPDDSKVVSITIGTTYYESVDFQNDRIDYFNVYLVIEDTREYIFTLSSETAGNPLRASIKIYRSIEDTNSIKDGVTDRNGNRIIRLKKEDFIDFDLKSGLYYILIEPEPDSGTTRYKLIVTSKP